MGLCEECSWLEKVDDKPVCTHPSLFVNYTIEKMKCSHFSTSSKCTENNGEERGIKC